MKVKVQPCNKMTRKLFMPLEQVTNVLKMLKKTSGSQLDSFSTLFVQQALHFPLPIKSFFGSSRSCQVHLFQHSDFFFYSCIWRQWWSLFTTARRTRTVLPLCICGCFAWVSESGRAHTITNNRMWQCNAPSGPLSLFLSALNQHANILKRLISSRLLFFSLHAAALL